MSANPDSFPDAYKLVADRGSFFSMPDETTETSIQHIAIKAPPLYLKSPGTWFKQLESQFALSGVTRSETKYHHVMAALPESIASEVIDSATTYEALKEAILNNLKGNKHELISQALAAITLGDKRPSQLVTEIKRRFEDIGVAVDDAIVKSRVLSALPPNLRSALVGHDNCPLDQYCKIPDSMLAVASSESPFTNIHHLAGSSDNNPFHLSPDRSDFRGRYNPDRNRHHHSQNIQSHVSLRDGHAQNKYAVRPFFAEQRPKICNSHIFYADRARSCRRWCQWPGNRAKIIQENERTPRQSRPNSPIKA